VTGGVKTPITPTRGALHRLLATGVKVTMPAFFGVTLRVTRPCVFDSAKPVIAMIHVGALPGTPASSCSVREIVSQAVSEARVYRDGGVHGIAIENMHDVPYLRGSVGPEITAAMTAIALAVKDASKLPCGIQILAGANHEALAVAHAADLQFARVEGYAFAHVADEGIIESSAASLLRYRRAIGAERVQVWADVKKKHSAHALTADVDIGETAAAVEFMRADAVIVTGAATGLVRGTLTRGRTSHASQGPLRTTTDFVSV